jgi:hypothetical protein
VARALRRYAFNFGSFVIVLSAWAALLLPPLSFYHRHPYYRLLDVVGELAKPQNAIYAGLPCQGWLFLGLFGALLIYILSVCRAILKYSDDSTVGIATLEVRIEVMFHDRERTRATVRREQLFHANRAGINAYKIAHVADSPTGTVDHLSIELNSILNGQNYTSELIRYGNRKRAEVFEIFKDDLPTNWLVTYLPSRVVHLAFRAGMFHRYIVRRTGQVAYDNEFDGDEGSVSLTATDYPVTAAGIVVNFAVGSEPAPHCIRAWRIRENAASSVALTKINKPGTVIYEVEARPLHKETLRVQWTC